MAERYDDVRSLSQRELRAMLERGRPEERVWALWALALASAPKDLAALVRRNEPDAGVRRNLAVVLAGHGEFDLLVALAKRDPAPEVRAAAMQLVTRLALDGKLPTALVVERAAHDSAVRVAILGTVFADAPAWLREVARSLLGDPDRDVRYEAFEALVRAGRADVVAAIAWLDDASDDEARVAVMRWTAGTPSAPGGERRVHTCALMLAHANASHRLRRIVVECARVATWHDLAPIIQADATLVRAFIQRSADAAEQIQHIPPATLVAIALREGGDKWLLAARDRLATVNVPDFELAPLLAEYRERCELRARDLEGEPMLQEELTLASELAATLTLH